MGGTIAKLIKMKFKVYTIFTTIEKNDPEIFSSPLRRIIESTQALFQLGVENRNDSEIKFLKIPDGDTRQFVLNYRKSVGTLKKIITDIEKNENVSDSEGNYIKEGKTLILTTSRMDAHRDHEETFNMVKNALRKRIILEFPVVNHMSSSFISNCIINISDCYQIKLNALNKYGGEIRKNRILWQDIDSLEKEMGQRIGVERAEGCFVSWHGYIPPIIKIIEI